MLKTKSVLTPASPDDGLRVLATRFRGRGLPTSRYDVWMANLGPSERLLRAMLDGKLSWAEFSRRYKAEMLSSSDMDRDNRTIKNHGAKFTLRLLNHLARTGNVTLLCHCAEDEAHCHRHLLAKLIERAQT